MESNDFASDENYRELVLQNSIEQFISDCREGYEGCEEEEEFISDFRSSFDELLQLDDDHGTIRTSLSDADIDENLTYLTESYYTYTDKEKILLRYAEKFRKRFLEQYYDRHRLIMALPNECNIHKFVSTSIRRSFLSYPELKSWQGCMDFVRDFLAYENDGGFKMPRALKSPSYLVLHQRGNSFEFATFLVSLLLGQGYNAFVVSGYAAKEVVECDTRKLRSPYLEKPKDDFSQTEDEEKVPNPYIFKPPPDFKSQFLQQEEDKKNKKSRELLIKKMEDEKRRSKEYERFVPDKYHGRRIHAWVLILPEPEGPKPDEIVRPIFIEPSSGIAFEISNEKVDQFYVSVESIWNDLNYWINLQTPPIICTAMKWDLENPEYWVKLLPEEHTELLLTEPSEFKDCIYEEKNLDMASSYVEEITISSAEFEKRYPDETKTVLYKKCRVELFSPYYHANGLIKRITMYQDFNYKNPINTTDEYLHRMDHLIKTYTDLKTNKVTDFYTKGRFDACKEHCYLINDENTISDERLLAFYHEVRFDGLSKIVTDSHTLVLDFMNRDDFLRCRKIEFINREPEILVNVKFIKKITDWFERNPSLPASKNISIRIFDLQRNEMHLKYFYDEGNYTRSSRAYKKLLVVSDDKKTFVFDSKLTWGYSPEEFPSPELILPLYYEFKELMLIEKDLLQFVDDSEVLTYKFLVAKNEEMENPQLSVSIFDRNRNLEERNTMLQKEQQMKEHSHRIFSGDIDYLQMYLAELGDPENLTKSQFAQIRDNRIKDFKKRVTKKTNRMKAEIKDCQQQIGRLESTLKQIDEDDEEGIDKINDEINELKSHIKTRTKALYRYQELASELYASELYKLKTHPMLAKLTS